MSKEQILKEFDDKFKLRTDFFKNNMCDTLGDNIYQFISNSIDKTRKETINVCINNLPEYDNKNIVFSIWIKLIKDRFNRLKNNIDIKEQFEQNFLDGDKLPAMAKKFTASGGLDIAEYFYELGKEETIKNIENRLPKENDLTNLTENHEIWIKIGERARGNNECLYLIKDIINKLKN